MARWELGDCHPSPPTVISTEKTAMTGLCAQEESSQAFTPPRGNAKLYSAVSSTLDRDELATHSRQISRHATAADGWPIIWTPFPTSQRVGPGGFLLGVVCCFWCVLRWIVSATLLGWLLPHVPCPPPLRPPSSLAKVDLSVLGDWSATGLTALRN